MAHGFRRLDTRPVLACSVRSSEKGAGKSRKEIADKLGVAEGTVKKHVQNIFEKTKCHFRLEVMALVIREVRQRPVEECG